MTRHVPWLTRHVPQLTRHVPRLTRHVGQPDLLIIRVRVRAGHLR